MEIRAESTEYEWNKWLCQGSWLNLFSQSWGWGSVLIAEGKKIERLAIIENEQIIAQAQVVYNSLPFGWQYAYCPKGPVIKHQVSSIKYQGILKLLIEHLKFNKKCIFFRFEPHDAEHTIHDTKKTIDINPRATVILDLEGSEENLLKAMRQKTRYNIHLAERKGLVVKQEKDLNNFLRLSEQTAKRDGFKLHDKIHYEKALDSNQSYQLLATGNNKVIATSIFIGFGNTFTYLYGASDYNYRDLMAPYLLQWQGIKLAKQLGYASYDFFGIAPGVGLRPTDSRLWTVDSYGFDPRHQYAGVTRFKLGFGGRTQEDPGTFDAVIDKKKYFIYKLLRKIRRLF